MPIPIIDWDQSIKLAGNQRHVAVELLELFIRDLNLELNQMKLFYAQKNRTALMRSIHKLRGGLCYCSLPRLHDAIIKLETAVKKRQNSIISECLNQFESEAETIFKHATPAI